MKSNLIFDRFLGSLQSDCFAIEDLIHSLFIPIWIATLVALTRDDYNFCSLLGELASVARMRGFSIQPPLSQSDISPYQGRKEIIVSEVKQCLQSGYFAIKDLIHSLFDIWIAAASPRDDYN